MRQQTLLHKTTLTDFERINEALITLNEWVDKIRADPQADDSLICIVYNHIRILECRLKRVIENNGER